MSEMGRVQRTRTRMAPWPCGLPFLPTSQPQCASSNSPSPSAYCSSSTCCERMTNCCAAKRRTCKRGGRGWYVWLVCLERLICLEGLV